MFSLEYEAEGSEVEKKFQKRVDDLNDTSEYDKTFGTKDGFGETDESDDTYKKLKDAAAEYNKFEDIYELPNPLRVTQAKKIKNESKEKIRPILADSAALKSTDHPQKNNFNQNGKINEAFPYTIVMGMCY